MKKTYSLGRVKSIPQRLWSGTGLERLDISTGILLELRAHYRQCPCLCVASAFASRGYSMPPSQDPIYTGLGQAVRIGTELLAALIVGGGLGWVVDTYLLGTDPWGMVAGLALGAVAGIRSAYRSAQEWPKS